MSAEICIKKTYSAIMIRTEKFLRGKVSYGKFSFQPNLLAAKPTRGLKLLTTSAQNNYLFLQIVLGTNIRIHEH